MGFRFKLQRVLDLKLKQEDEKKNQIATLMQAIKTKEDELEALISEKKQKEFSLNDNRKRGISILEIRNINQYLLFLDKKINTLRFEISSLESNLNQKRLEYLELQKERKTFEKLKEKDYEKYLYNEKKEEEKMIDQIVTFNKNNTK
ncbi:flagellar export protein FliJ [Acetoanaerobium noterae]|jgi:flagellar FliJ protein|uniref:flagellar export protein FliJ n=1 Tax=Acetoanaerobium noterae TaxID=745369 RepID=UPI001B76768E|nr:flagellar export protein FliJ [Acetoanaerobium noterae]MBP8762815.1 flagellar export protein FliJ [Acetoanaerobium sp.]MBP9499803.1 flagellar export protein FliJ [Acetoanaerobium sp.]MBP9562422.1 flagellar export protein FliJ [Acetoanaerobium sp.]MDK2803679.1 flagellar protein FliJ [Peptostreptococcaceae bacterium]